MGKRILITDDAAFMRMMLKDILSKNGYEIAGEAENGKVAI
ncbi:MAG: two-component system response regulator, partial [Butyrivibrio sp.]|nr:two-component system response regulator [Butyrivibrio sp.]